MDAQAIRNALILENRLSILDVAFANAWMPPGPIKKTNEEKRLTESYALLLIYLLRASLEGHLCAAIDVMGALTPDPALWLKPFSEDCGKAYDLLLKDWQAACTGQIACCPLAMSQDEATQKHLPIVFANERFYLQKNHLLENGLYKSFRDLLKKSADWQLSRPQLEKKAQDLIDQKELLPEQTEALLALGGNRQITSLIGGPGTGKTHTAKHLIRTLIGLAGSQFPLKIALAAPTGRAAATLQRGIQLPDLVKKDCFAGTLHALLGISGSIIKARHNKCNPLVFDVILVDESSMIDAQLMQALFQAIKPGARVILMGDSHQLPPVEIGGIFTDLVDQINRQTPGQITHLTKCMRTEILPILQLCDQVRAGDAQGALKLAQQSEAIGFCPLETENDWKKARLQIIDRCCQGAGESDLAKAKRNFETHKLLTPLKVGYWGADLLNASIFSKAIGHHKDLSFAPLMVTSNQHHLEIYNGELGILQLKRNSYLRSPNWRDRAQCAHFGSSNREGEIERTLPAALLTDCELAWCCSIHKAQGSEFESVDLIIPPGAERMSRQLLYTALTRARKKITIWASQNDFKRAVETSSSRQSGLLARFSRET